MATNKTLTPTNVTIKIPEFTDQPDQRVNSNCIDKEADAINALNGKIVSLGTSTALGELNGTGTKTLADDITNYSFIHIRVGYYASGYANYGSIIIPVSCIPFTTDTTYDYSINCLSGTTPGKVLIGFNNKNTLRVTSTAYNYVVVMGIK